MAERIESNITGLSYIEEASLKVLPTTPIIYRLQPNSYSSFGGKITTVSRKPINPSRQLQKGVTTDLDASGGFNIDLVTDPIITRLMQGFFFADIHELPATSPFNGAAIPITSVTAANSGYNAASGLAGFPAGAIVAASGFSTPSNNGIKVVTSASTATLIPVNPAPALDELTPPLAAELRMCGFQFTVGDVDITMNGKLVRLTSTVEDLTTIYLQPGDWVFLGSDVTSNSFDNNVGFARVSVITTNYIEFDKVNWGTPVAEVGTGKSIQMYYSSVLKNENNPALIKRRTYHLERTLGDDDNGLMSEYLIGAVANEFTLNVPHASETKTDMTFVALDNMTRDGATGIIPGTRPASIVSDGFNTSTDIRLAMRLVDDTDSAPVPIFARAEDFTLSIKNNVTPDKAIAVLGAFDTSAGTFEVTGKLSIYYNNTQSTAAIRENASVTVDIAFIKDNKGLLFDVPLLTLASAGINVSADKAIMLPIDFNAAESKFNHTLLLSVFSYLPNVA